MTPIRVALAVPVPRFLREPLSLRKLLLSS